jgi:hypothetical protein
LKMTEHAFYGHYLNNLKFEGASRTTTKPEYVCEYTRNAVRWPCIVPDIFTGFSPVLIILDQFTHFESDFSSLSLSVLIDYSSLFAGRSRKWQRFWTIQNQSHWRSADGFWFLIDQNWNGMQ